MMYGAEFELVAEALHRTKPDKEEYQYASKRTQWNIDVNAIARNLESKYPRFDYQRFVDRCTHG